VEKIELDTLKLAENDLKLRTLESKKLDFSLKTLISETCA